MASSNKSTASPAQVEANRKNAQRSTGPKSAAGKNRSRMNALKHGLTGAGLALPTEDLHRIEERFRALHEEMAPQSTLGSILVKDIALMSIRLDRSARLEVANLALKIRHAPADFDEARRAEAEYTLGYIGMEPITHRRKPRATPEGIEILLKAFRNLYTDLDRNNDRWDFMREMTLEAYLGRRADEIPVPRSRAISQALIGNLDFLDPDEREAVAKLPHPRIWARPAMLDFLNEQIAELIAHRDTLDFAAIEQDRIESIERALFDPGKDATLARRYESASRRNLYRAIREFREVEATGEITFPEPSEAVETARTELFAAGDAAETPPTPVEPGDEHCDKSIPDKVFDPKSGSFGSSPRIVPTAPAGTLQGATTQEESVAGVAVFGARLDL